MLDLRACRSGTARHAATVIVGVFFAVLEGHAAAQTLLDNAAYALFASDLKVQMRGVSSFVFSAKQYASPFIANPAKSTMMPIVLGASESDEQYPLPVGVSARLPGGGRLVAFGHESIILDTTSPGSFTLVSNCLRWLAGSRPLATLRVAVAYDFMLQPMQQLAQAAAGISKPFTGTVRVVPPEAFAAQQGKVDVYFIDTNTEYTSDQAAAIKAWALKGGALLVGGHAWYWGYEHKENVVTGLTVNRILWDLGLAVTTDYQYGFSEPPKAGSVPREWMYYNSYWAQYRIQQSTGCAGRVTSFPDTYRTVANQGLKFTVRYLPPQSHPTGAGPWAALKGLQCSSLPPVAVGPGSPLEVATADPLVVLQAAMTARAVLDGDLTALAPSPSAALFPGLPPANASRVNVTLNVSCTYSGIQRNLDGGAPVWRSTGLYAPPGAVVTVLVPSGAAGKGLAVQIGSHTDDLSFKTTWHRIPTAVSSFPITAAATRAGSPLGGLLYIVVPKGARLGTVRVTVQGAIRAPRFKLGVTSPATWKSTVRTYPGPWAELESSKIILTVPSEAVRAMNDPTALLNFWDRVQNAQAYVSALPTARGRADRVVVDADISYGWMHAGYPIMAYNLPEVIQEMTDLSFVSTRGSWGLFHELGHMLQWPDAQFKGTGEASNNIYTYYTMTVLCKVPPAMLDNATPASRAAARAAYIANGRNWQRDWEVFLALDTYLQLAEGFGWGFYTKVFTFYKNLATRIQDEDARIQTWIRVTSQAAGRNLAPFYRAWGFPVASETAAALEQLPEWAQDPMTPLVQAAT